MIASRPQCLLVIQYLTRTIVTLCRSVEEIGDITLHKRLFQLEALQIFTTCILTCNCYQVQCIHCTRKFDVWKSYRMEHTCTSASSCNLFTWYQRMMKISGLCGVKRIKIQCKGRTEILGKSWYPVLKCCFPKFKGASLDRLSVNLRMITVISFFCVYFSMPINYYSILLKRLHGINKGKYVVCYDPYDVELRQKEAWGKFPNGITVRKYKQHRQLINLTIDITSTKGWNFKFWISGSF